MKKLILILLILMTGLSSYSLFSQTPSEAVALGLPGDNLNLYAVLDVFQNSKTLEEFEREINSRDSNINNLDLDNDNAVDYISVMSYNQGHFYSIVLRVSFSPDDFQDVAVIEVSKNNAGKILIQVIGDEALYGENYILEPSARFANETPNPGYVGGERVIVNNYASSGIVYVNDWPIVVYLFSPLFSVYISPWYWGYYPVYWSPWTPIRYYSYWVSNYHYYNSPYYHRVSFVRFPSHHSYYLKRRTISPVVIRNRRSGAYSSTYEGRTYRKPQAPVELSRTEVRREVRRSAQSSGVQSSNRSENRQSTRQPVQQVPRGDNRQNTKEQNREFNRQPVQRVPREDNRQNTKEQNREFNRQPVQQMPKQKNKQGIREQNNESSRQPVQPSRRQDDNQNVRGQNSGAIRQPVQSPPRQQNMQPTRLKSSSSNGSSSMRQSDYQMRQASRKIKRMNRSESKKNRP